MGPPYSLRIPRVRRYSGYRPLLLDFIYKTLTFFGRLSHALRLSLRLLMPVLTPSVFLLLVWPPSLSLATTREISVDFSSSGYLDVSVPQVPSVWLWIHHAVHEVCSCGFPHSDICGSQLICSSPQLFAAYHVLRRLLMPRHSPYALIRLNFPFSDLSITWFSSFSELLEFHKTFFRLFPLCS